MKIKILKRKDGKVLSTWGTTERRLHISGDAMLVIDWQQIGARKWIIHSHVFTTADARSIYQELKLHFSKKKQGTT